MNLVLGVVWLLGALAMIAYEQVTNEPLGRFRGTNVSAYWLLLGLAAYNFVRWWSQRSFQAERRALEQAQAERLREVRYRERPAEPDPNFNFTDQPPPPTDITDRPPRQP